MKKETIIEWLKFFGCLLGIPYGLLIGHVITQILEKV